jgi:hypothetical protein
MAKNKGREQIKAAMDADRQAHIDARKKSPAQLNIDVLKKRVSDKIQTIHDCHVARGKKSVGTYRTRSAVDRQQAKDEIADYLRRNPVKRW